MAAAVFILFRRDLSVEIRRHVKRVVGFLLIILLTQTDGASRNFSDDVWCVLGVKGKDSQIRRNFSRML